MERRWRFGVTGEQHEERVKRIQGRRFDFALGENTVQALMRD